VRLTLGRTGRTCLRWRCSQVSLRLLSAVRHTWIGWLAVTFVVTSLYLGALLRLPRWLIDLSAGGARTTVPADFPIVAFDGDGACRRGTDALRRFGSIAAANAL